MSPLNAAAPPTPPPGPSQPGSGTPPCLHAVVQDGSGLPVRQARLTVIEGPADAVGRSAESGARGVLSLEVPGAGSLAVECRAPGYRPARLSVRALANGVSLISITLHPSG